MKKKFLFCLSSIMALTLLSACGKPTYSVRFMDGDELYVEQKITEGALATKPEQDPTKAATRTKTYTFNAWFLDDKAYDFNSPVTKNIELVANYTETTNKVKITFDYDDGKTAKEEKQVDIDSAISAPTTAPTGYEKEGYSYNFTNWKCGQTVLEPGVTIASSDMTFVAQYEKGSAVTYTATVKYLYDNSKEDKEFDYTVLTRDTVLTNIKKELPTEPANEYYWKTELPTALPLEDVTYKIQSKHFFTNDFSKGDELDTDHLSFLETSKWKIEDNLLHYTVTGNGSLLRTIQEDYDQFVLEYVCKSSTAASGNRTGVNIGNSDFDSSQLWLRMSKNYTGGEVVSNYSTGGATFNVDDFNSFKFEVYKNANNAGRIKFYLNGKNILGTSAFTLTDVMSGFIGFGVCPKSGSLPDYYFKSISITPYIA